MRVGLEIEFVVPAGRTRRDLALALARPGERLRDVAQRADMPLGAPDEKPPRFWSGVFRGCRIESADGRWRWSVVQEMGVAVDADSPAHLGEARRWPWVGVLDPACADRVAEALEATWDPRAALERAAPLLGWRVHGPESGAPFALALHQACAEILQLGRSVDPWVAVGEGGRVAAVASFEQLGRERVAEVVTAPLPLGAVGRSIREVYAAVAAVGAQIGRESGTHVHFDGAPFRSPAALARVLNVLDAWREPTWTLLGWPGSRLTGPIGPPVVYLANRCAENGASWDELRSRLADYGVTKFCDLNVANLVDEHPRKPTFELRILPVDAEPSLMVRRTQLSIEIVLGALRATGPITHPGRQPATRAAAREMLGHVGIDPSAWTDLLALLPDHRPLSARAPFRPARLPQDAARRVHAASQLARALGIGAVPETRLRSGRLEVRQPRALAPGPGGPPGIELQTIAYLWGLALDPAWIQADEGGAPVLVPPTSAFATGAAPKIPDGYALPADGAWLRAVLTLDAARVPPGLVPRERAAFAKRLAALRRELGLRCRVLGLDAVVRPPEDVLFDEPTRTPGRPPRPARRRARR